jgi:hypothetical protein
MQYTTRCFALLNMTRVTQLTNAGNVMLNEVKHLSVYTKYSAHTDSGRSTAT